MKRGTESRYRMKLIQEMHADKEQQKFIDIIVREAFYTYKEAYLDFKRHPRGWERTVQDASQWADNPVFPACEPMPMLSAPTGITIEPKWPAPQISYGLTVKEATDALCNAMSSLNNLQSAT